jgi:hypothetical protein
MSENNYLLLGVEALTKPAKHGEWQDIIQAGVPVGTQKITIELPPLLEQLDGAIRSSMGGAPTSGAALAFEGAVLNTAALFTAMKISTQIRDWCRIAKVQPVKNTSTNLVNWYIKLDQGPIALEVETFHVKILSSWAKQIKAMLDPPRERDLPDACPVCGATEWWDMKDGKKYPRPLVVRYRPSQEDMIGQAKGICRACATVFGVRELAYEIEQAEIRYAGSIAS